MTDTLTPTPVPTRTPPIAPTPMAQPPRMAPPTGSPPATAPTAQKASKTWLILFAVIALVAGLGIGYFVANSKTSDMQSQRDDAQAEVTQLNGELDDMQTSLDATNTELTGLEASVASLTAANTQLETDLAAAQQATGVAVGTQEICTTAAADASALVDSYENMVGDLLNVFNGVLGDELTVAEVEAAFAHIDEQWTAQETAHDTVHNELAECSMALGG